MLLSIKSLGAKIALKEGDGVKGGAGSFATFRHFEIIRKMYDVKLRFIVAARYIKLCEKTKPFTFLEESALLK